MYSMVEYSENDVLQNAKRKSSSLLKKPAGNNISSLLDRSVVRRGCAVLGPNLLVHLSVDLVTLEGVEGGH